MRRLWLVPALLLAALVPTAAQQDINARIRDEVNERSQVMRSIHYLTDVYGPRVTGSPSLKAAGEWAVQTMGSWGMTNGRMEPWEFGHAGWANERFTAHILSPVKDQLTAEVLAWTPGMPAGTVRAHAFHLDPAGSHHARAADGVPREHQEPGAGPHRAGGRVRTGAGQPHAAGQAPRRGAGARALRSQSWAAPPVGEAGVAARRRRRRRRCPRAEIGRRIDQFLVANGALIRINDARREHGQIVAFDNRTFDLTRTVPTVVMRNEDYGRIARILADGTPVELEFDIVNRIYPEGRTQYNAVAEIEGTRQARRGDHDRRAPRFVAVGHGRDGQRRGLRRDDGGRAHPEGAGRAAPADDSRGALERRGAGPAGVAGLRRADVRFVRVAHSRVRHARGVSQPGQRHGPAARRQRVRAGRGRGCHQGRAGAVRRSRAWPAPTPTGAATSGGTDSTSFNNAGLPGINFVQDPIEYDTHTHHTNLDTYERVLESDVKAATIVIAATVYQLAMRDEMLPRFEQSGHAAAGATLGHDEEAHEDTKARRTRRRRTTKARKHERKTR